MANEPIRRTPTLEEFYAEIVRWSEAQALLRAILVNKLTTKETQEGENNAQG